MSGRGAERRRERRGERRGERQGAIRSSSEQLAPHSGLNRSLDGGGCYLMALVTTASMLALPSLTLVILAVTSASWPPS